MMKAFFPDIRPVPFKDRDSMMQAMRDKRIDAVFCRRAATLFWMQSPAAGNCCVFLDGAYLSEAHLGEGMTVMVAGKDQNLAAALESGLPPCRKTAGSKKSICVISPPDFIEVPDAKNLDAPVSGRCAALERGTGELVEPEPSRSSSRRRSSSRLTERSTATISTASA